MQSLFPKPKTLDQARRQVNIVERACHLWLSGYDWYLSTTNAYLFGVCGPEGQHYCVDMRANTCSCPGFKDDGDCKHRIAIANTDACSDACLCLLHEQETSSLQEVCCIADRQERLIREAGYCPF